MRLQSITKVVALTAAIAMFSACGSTGPGGGAPEAFNPNQKVEITFGGWSFKTNPEFQALKDGFEKVHPNVTVKLVEYQTDDYDTQMVADLSGGSAPDVFPIKNLSKYYTYAIDSEGLLELGSVANGYANDSHIDITQYDLDGKYFALPFRQDSWVIYYNKTMFEKAGVTLPTNDWTWDDYIKTAEELKQKLPAAGYDASRVYPVYHHATYQSVFQSFTTAQSDGDPQKVRDNFLSGNYDYMKEMYANVFLKAQQEGLTMDYNTATGNRVTYQPQFATQKAAMLPMGTWFASQLIAQQNGGEADQFEWGWVTVPQNPNVKSETGKPITFGDPTGLAVSASSSGQERAAALEFLKYATGSEGAKQLTAISLTPAYLYDGAVDDYFGVKGMATDEQTKQAWVNHDIRPENFVSKYNAELQTQLKTMNSSIMTETVSLDDAIAQTNSQIKSQNILNQ